MMTRLKPQPLQLSEVGWWLEKVHLGPLAGPSDLARVTRHVLAMDRAFIDHVEGQAKDQREQSSRLTPSTGKARGRETLVGVQTDRRPRVTPAQQAEGARRALAAKALQAVGR